MTTIIYSHEEQLVAYDSRTTAHNMICTDNAEKSIKRNGITFVLSGYPADNEKIVSAYFSDDRVIDSRVSPHAFAINHKAKAVYVITRIESELVVTPVDYSMSLGSGGSYAIAALDHGKTAKQAVKYAMTRDSCTGGKVRVVKV